MKFCSSIIEGMKFHSLLSLLHCSRKLKKHSEGWRLGRPLYNRHTHKHTHTHTYTHIHTHTHTYTHTHTPISLLCTLLQIRTNKHNWTQTHTLSEENSWITPGTSRLRKSEVSYNEWETFFVRLNRHLNKFYCRRQLRESGISGKQIFFR